MASLPKRYDPCVCEEKWYSYWLEQGYFYSRPDNRKPYTIVMPPPNVTGVLHMGHMLNNTIQDVLIRRARLLGYNACWVPGTDHASIATEAKVVAKLKSQGIKKSDLSREEFLDHVWKWTHKHGGIILEQLKKLGCSCDWKRTKFTMDKDLSETVIKTFVELFNKGFIYKGYRMVNWDPEAKTTLSDEEVIYKEQQGQLFFIKYKIEGTDDYLTIATTRPETIFGDTAVCVHPDDNRYNHLIGKRAIVPVCERSIPIIADDYVDTEFGTGCLKITPAHDINDKSIGERHNLEFIDIFNDDATLNRNGLNYEGRDRFLVRKAVADELKSSDMLLKVETHHNKVGVSERTGAVIEPRISEQWFLKMEVLSGRALESVLKGEVNILPKKFLNTYKHWMENIHDWNISRQLLWGHRIPAYYYGDGKMVVAETADKALKLAQEKSSDKTLTAKDLSQDNDVLDTWFSSWLWPMSVFNGVLDPDNKDFKYYYPTDDLVTAPEILFFWVARMVMAGYCFEGKRPFKNVYLTGIVRDKQRRKMSKSLGNSPDPLELIKTYGADGVRVGMLLSSPAGNDLMFDEDLCKQGAGFTNKIWNAFRLISSWETEDTPPLKHEYTALLWFKNRFYQTLEVIDGNFDDYRISDALMNVYKLIWNDFCSWFLEAVKPCYGRRISLETYQNTIQILADLLRVLHPFTPFISEEIWHRIESGSPEQSLVVSSWPKQQNYDKAIIETFDLTCEVVSNIRTVRKAQRIPFKEKVELIVSNNERQEIFEDILKKLGNTADITISETPPKQCVSFRVRANEWFIPIPDPSDNGIEIEKLKQELSYAKGFLDSVRSKLSNARFVQNAPENVVALERKKESDALAKIEVIEMALKKFYKA